MMLFLFCIGLFLSELLDLKVGKYSFMIEIVIILPFLLFITPETVAILAAISKLVFSRKNKIVRSIFSFFMYSFGTFLYYSTSLDYFKLPLFVFGILLSNFFLLLIYFNIETFKEIMGMIPKSYLILFSLSLIMSFGYFFAEVKLGYLFYLFIVYALISYQLYEYVRQFNVSLIEKIEFERLKNISESLLKLKNLVFENEERDLERSLQKLLEIVCKISGFHVAVLSLFNNNTGYVERIAHFGLTEEDFERAKNNKPKISEVVKYFNKKFENNGVYFIPEGLALIESNIGFIISHERKIDSERSWDPKDLLLIPIKDELSNLIGYISLDVPQSGMRPTKNDMNLLNFLSWIVYKFLSKTLHIKYWLNDTGVYFKNASYVSFIRFCENKIKESENVTLAYLDIENYLFEKFRNMAIYYKISSENYMILFFNVSKRFVLLYLDEMNNFLKEKYSDVSLSIGLVYSKKNQKNIFQLIYEAKKALKIAKKSGGGRIHSL